MERNAPTRTANDSSTWPLHLARSRSRALYRLQRDSSFNAKLDLRCSNIMVGFGLCRIYL